MPDTEEKPKKKKPKRENPFRGKLIEDRRELPDQPGVYLFHDAEGKVVYVGKATSIRSRVGNHFSAPEGKAVEMIAVTERIGPWGYLGVVPLLTGAIGMCPLYSILGINTCPLARR